MLVFEVWYGLNWALNMAQLQRVNTHNTTHFEVAICTLERINLY